MASTIRCVAVMDMTPDWLYADIKPGWAHEMVLSSQLGIQITPVTPASI